MIEIKRKEECCGCGACFDACSHNAIRWEPDIEGFSYPHVDTEKCVNCGLCNKVCPLINSERLNQRNRDFEPKVFGAFLKDEQLRLTSTSGGAFWGLAAPFIEAGGYVAGAVFDDQFRVVSFVTNDIKELEKIRRSKYVQGDFRGLYQQVRSLLVSGKKVMATGLPCQMAALRQYLHNDYDNLIVVDLICHSVTSPLAFAMYKESLERKFKSKLVDYHPKNKEYGGWHHFAVKATFENGKIYHKCGADDTFTWLFVGSNNLLSRPSCYECRFKVFPKPSDITIGDYWGVEFIDPDFDSPKGVSKITINSKKGLDYYLKVDTFCDKEYSKEIAIFSNRRSATQIRSVLPPDSSLRQQFVADLNKIGYDSCMKKYNPNEENVIIKRIKWILSRITK